MFSLDNIFYAVDSSTLILGALFIISFTVLNFILSMFFKDRETGKTNKGVSGTIALVMSVLIIYGFYNYDFDLTHWFYDLGIPEGLLSTLAPIIILAGALYFSYSKKEGKFYFYRPFLILGFLFVLFGIFLAYEKSLAIVIGVILLIIGFIILSKRKKKKIRDVRLRWE